MAVGFGFSMSDIYAGLKLLKESVHALDEKRGATSDYTSLLQEVEDLQVGLRSIEDLWHDETLQESQRVALKNGVLACRTAIDEFLGSIAKYQPHLAEVRTKGLAASISKIKWAICQKEDLKIFRSKLQRHLASINMLLTTIQTKQSMSSKNALGPVNIASSVVPNMMHSMSLEQRNYFLAMTEQNQELLRTIQDLRALVEMQRSVPSQVLLQQPVILYDAMGRVAPFHLEFVDSVDCFFAVLNARFAKTSVSTGGLEKLQNGEFTLQDTRCKREINFLQPWRLVFRPGQHVDMQMVYHRFACTKGQCPSCETAITEDGWETQCEVCGLTYQHDRSTGTNSDDWQIHTLDRDDMQIEGHQSPYVLINSNKGSERRTFFPPKSTEGASFDGFRRVHIVSQPLALLTHLFPSLQLIHDFAKFADMLRDMPQDKSPYLEDIHALNQRARTIMQEMEVDTPAFSSFYQITESRHRLTRDSQDLRRDINALITELCNDPGSVHLLQHIKERSAGSPSSDYYSGALNMMVAMSQNTRSKTPRSPKPKSQEWVQWRMLDAKIKR